MTEPSEQTDSMVAGLARWCILLSVCQLPILVWAEAARVDCGLFVQSRIRGNVQYCRSGRTISSSQNGADDSKVECKNLRVIVGMVMVRWVVVD